MKHDLKTVKKVMEKDVERLFQMYQEAPYGELGQRAMVEICILQRWIRILGDAKEMERYAKKVLFLGDIEDDS